ncbi:tol-pal system protein YbgF [Desulfuromonas versatilis]|nr:tol-pal system protein YbgF [Desulfuromonas versatilis]
MERDLEEMKRRLANAERSLAGQQDTNAPLEGMARSQADLQAGLDSLRVEQQSSAGRIQDLARERDQLREELKLVRDDLGLKLTALEDRVAKLEQGGGGVAAPAAAGAPETPEGIYARALDLIQRDANYAQGRTLLQDFLQRYPQHSLSVNAMYWVGESYYGEKKYENAILQFQDVIQKYQDHPKVASALLKQGLAFKALGDTKNAKVIMQKIIDSFPLADEAKKAKGYLAEWKG